MNTHEEWRTIAAWPKYEVSNLGRVRRAVPACNTWAGRILKPYVHKTGYVSARVCGQTQHDKGTVLIHGLVAEAFLGPRPDGCEVNHINADKTDNRACNLEYVTPRQNMKHAMRLDLVRRGEQVANAKATTDQVRTIRELRAAGLKHREIAERVGLGRSNVANILCGSSWRHVA